MLNHSRSQSDTTNFRSYYFHRMSEPRSADAEQVADAAAALGQLKSSRKRSFEELQFFDKTITSPNNFCYSTEGSSFLPSSKRAKTAPSSPISFPPSSGSMQPRTPNFKFPELPLTPPSAISSSKSIFAQQLESAQSSSSSDTPSTPPPSIRSSPRGMPKILKLDRKPLTTIPETAFYYPDTCYSFGLLNTSGAVPEHNQRAHILEEQNKEWRDHYSFELSHSDSKLYKKYRNYCDGLKLAEFSGRKPIPVNTKILLPSASKLTSFIDNQYNRYDGLVNYPYASNYNYQLTGYLNDVHLLTSSPELYSHRAGKGYSYRNDALHRNYNLPPLSQVLKMSSLDNDNAETDTDSSRPTPALAYPPRASTSTANVIRTSRPLSPARRSSVAKFINTSISPRRSSLDNDSSSTNAPPTTITTIDSPPQSPKKSSHRRQSHSFHSHRIPRRCISCHSTQSPCWRPSWAPDEGQLCNSCGLRYKKTRARCLNPECLRIPAKGEWTLMKNRGKTAIPDYNGEGEKTGEHYSYKCLHCDGEVAVDEQQY
ncbi:DEKNAAC105553 [Brettanomyces naardenensis]|uniref:DEKNAAC105553 n=1 Tax=Brettanomyces naardenensis TaxID=13370 RepID=A0A448YTV8_BRENA|nr:DEKNAAC105553 [Brettanomyces naardenensis]